MELLERHFDIALETPDGIKKLRELILSLAMKGKLVKQDPNDKPASEFIKEIEAVKFKLIKEGKIKNQEPLSSVKPEEFPYVLPESWACVRLGALGETQTGTTPAKKDIENEGSYIPFIGPGDILDFQINYKNNGLSEKGLQLGRLIRKNSIMMVCIGGSIGKSAINEMDVSCNQQINTITPYIHETVQTIFNTVKSSYFQSKMLSLAGGSATPIINKQKWCSIPVPIPPLAEQKRIVEKINQLMALCDKLEAERNERDKSKIKIHSTAMNRLLSAPDSSAFNSSWSFITKHFSELYSVTQNVDELKKAILQLAVMGKLVPQDVNDQPVSELLKEIVAEKERLVKEGKIKKQVSLPPIKPDEIPFELPNGWEWCRFQNLFFSIRYGTSKKCGYHPGLVPVLRIPNIINGKVVLDDLKSTKLSLKEQADLSLEKNDILIIRSNGSENLVGRSAIVSDESIGFSYAGYLMRIRICVDFVSSNFLYLVLGSPIVRKAIEGPLRTTSGVKNINSKEISQLIFPLPPLNEQKRIIKKIDQLMELCNSLQQQIKDSTVKKSEILEAVLARV